MTNQSPEQKQEVSLAADVEPHPPASAGGEGPSARDVAAEASGKLVPVNEAIKYRRRAQQAESSLQQFEQRLKDTQAQLDERLEQLATAEAQRDELRHQIDTLRTRSSAERMLHAAGATDVETAMALLEKRAAFSEDPDEKRLQQAVEQLLQDKPILIAPAPALPDKTASPRLDGAIGARLTQSAARAARTGNRRDVAQYLRLRRQSPTLHSYGDGAGNTNY